MTIITQSIERATRLGLSVVSIALAITGLHSPVHAQANYPDKPIRLVVPYTPGGGADTNSRMLAQPMSAILGQPIVIENRPGASGVVGAMAVLQAPADGYTLGLGNIAANAINPALQPTQFPYHPVKDFAGVTRVGMSSVAVTVPPTLGVKSVAELIAHAKAAPKPATKAAAVEKKKRSVAPAQKQTSAAPSSPAPVPAAATSPQSPALPKSTEPSP